MSTPMHPTSILTLDELDKKVDQTSYRGMIDSLIYLTTSRLDIMFSVCMCSQFQADPRESHLTLVKRTTNLGLWYKKYDEYMLKGYSDADFTGDRIERKSTSR
ncbi:hypothetical protein CR513_15609, partial [Mucuna pruriens]